MIYRLKIPVSRGFWGVFGWHQKML